MISQHLKLFLLIYLGLLSVVIFIAYRYKQRFWTLFGSVIIPLVFSTLVLFNLASFTRMNQISVSNHHQRRLHLLPTNHLIDLFSHGTARARLYWIYPLVDIYYQGRTLYIPEKLLGSLDLTVGELLVEGRLGGVITSNSVQQLSDDEVISILALDHEVLQFRSGNIFYFVIENSDPEIPIYLLTRGNQFFFVPEDFLPGIEWGV